MSPVKGIQVGTKYILTRTDGEPIPEADAALLGSADDMLKVLKEFVGAELREDFLRIILPKARALIAKIENTP